MKETKVEEFISLKQGLISVKDNFLKFVKLYNSGDTTLQEVWKATWRRLYDGTNACYSCGKLGHMVKDCPNKRSQ